jgi:TolB-like protein
MSIVRELKRRNVFRVAIAYVIVGWLILQLTDVLMPLLSLPEWVGRFVFLLLLVGFPLALFFAWAYELTPEGIKKEKHVDRSQSVTHLTGRKLDFTIIGLMAVAILYLVVDNYVLEQAPSDTAEVVADKSIAVLPFVALSSGEDDSYFADGLTEEILNALTQLPELQVTARTSSFFFKGQNLPVPEIAARLDVGHVVEGSVRRDGERVRITAQLIRASDGFHLWSDSYDRTLDDVFAVQEDIAENIAETLGVLLDDNARRLMRSVGIRDVEAFIAYQKGTAAFDAAHGASSITDGLVIANEYFDRALEAAPDLIRARLMKTDRAGHIIQGIVAGVRDEEYPGQAQEALAALQEEYDLARQGSPPGNQRDALDLERTLWSEDWSRLPELIQKAMQLGECSEMAWTGDVIPQFGWAEPLAEKYREIIACNPMDVNASYYLPWALIWAGDPEAALQAVEEAENRGLSHRWLEETRYHALLAAGRVNDALAMAGPESRNMVRQIKREALAGDPALARQMAEEFSSRPNANSSFSLRLAAIVGDPERANEFAARIDPHPGSAISLSLAVSNCFCGAPFDLEATPNYKARIEEAGFPWPPPKPIDYPTKTW